MDRKNLLKAVNFDFPDAIPVVFHVNPACWDHYPREDLAALLRTHTGLFPEGPPEYIEKGEPVPHPPWCTSGTPWTDPWGCVWETSVNGFVGAVRQHSVKELEEIAALVPPDPENTTHWYPVQWERGVVPGGGSIGFFGCLRSGEIGHGHTFLKLVDILGYEAAVCGLHDADPRVLALLRMLEEFNLGLVERFIEYGQVEWLGYAEDLGMQQGPMISPELFRRHILPVYRRIMEPAHEHDAIIHMHSDGDIRALVPDLLTLPLRVLNLQDRVNGVSWIEENLKGRVVIDLDLDRQHVTVSGTPADVRAHVREVLRKLGDRAGGLIITFGLYPGTPLENAAALMDALEEGMQDRNQWGR
ncbi:MAG: hypothetical protein EA427_05610 [Spirochaetaceae bacterium]|nr:MAG: hypothetical protein EA427_05610 [Spirochaetaceae bacterium]